MFLISCLGISTNPMSEVSLSGDCQSLKQWIRFNPFAVLSERRNILSFRSFYLCLFTDAGSGSSHCFTSIYGVIASSNCYLNSCLTRYVYGLAAFLDSGEREAPGLTLGGK